MELLAYALTAVPILGLVGVVALLVFLSLVGI